jgi:hypothetical protein
MAVRSFSLGMAVGYVLGAKAGERRYEQIVNWSQKIRNSRLAEKVTSETRDLVKDRASQVVETVKARGLRDLPVQARGRDREDNRERDQDEDDNEPEGLASGESEGGHDDYDVDDRGTHEYEDRADEQGTGEEDQEVFAREEDRQDADDEDRPYEDVRDRKEAEQENYDEDDYEDEEGAEERAPASSEGRGLGSRLGGVVAAARERGRVD